MVVINECRIDAEGKCLIIEATVDSLNYYDKVYIDSVIIDNENTYSPAGPSNKPVFQKKFDPICPPVITDEDHCHFVSTEDSNCQCGNVHMSPIPQRHIRIVITERELKGSSLNNNLFFVYVVASGYPKPNCPCGMDNQYTMAVAVNMRPIYNMAMGYVKELNSECVPPKGFIDMILRIKAFELSLKTGHYAIAFEQWNKLFKCKKNVPSLNRPCGCGNN